MPVVRLSGTIGSVFPLRPGLSLSSCAGVLERAFAVPDAKAVAIVVNSPGGSAVQSHLIFKRIRDHATEKKRPVIVFCEDAAASGGYMIACAGDEIFADPSSFVGSIGVVYAAFGFDRLIERLGVERRVHTAGESKAMLDPFRPEADKDVERLKEIQARVHETFIALVKARRGAKLKDDGEGLFTGAVWSGSEALALGLVDGIGELRSVLRERYGEKVRLKLIGARRASIVARLLRRDPMPTQAGLIEPEAVIAALEERASWARLGL